MWSFLLKLKVDREIAKFPACTRISISERGDSDLIMGNDELPLVEKTELAFCINFRNVHILYVYCMYSPCTKVVFVICVLLTDRT